MSLAVYQWEVNSVAEAKVLIAGCGVTGLSAAAYFSRNQIAFGLADERLDRVVAEDLSRRFDQAVVHQGGFDASVFTRYETIVLSPGIPRSHPAVVAALDAGVEVISDIEVFARVVNAPVIAVTGSNGKSTVVDLLGKMAEAANIRARTGGNIGTGALELLDGTDAELYILELSSFQLESTFTLKPSAAVVLNLSEDHMDRYGSVAEYAHAKERVYKQAARQIINRDDMIARSLARSSTPMSFGLDAPDEGEFGVLRIDGGDWLAFGRKALMPTSELKLIGQHNVANVLAALALGQAVKMPMSSMLAACRDYRGLPHRTQWVGEFAGVTWVNDSKATNVGATAAALKGIDAPVILLAGGQAKGADLGPLAQATNGRLRAAILFGEDADSLDLVLRDSTRIERVSCLQEAVQCAARLAQTGDVVMLSPACASFDMFRDYQHRGEEFMRLVNALEVH